ncbi:MAG: ADP-glyceromanno-heptose 6-epimerase [Desulfovibrionaceae bacterium]|nr:ADP-glyceromanno-heptose 6-epimerase [Desulfovibrionaceae bacterium]
MYIVTGGAGFIGSVLVRKLNDEGIDDIVIVDNLASTEKWRNLVKCRYREYLHRSEFIENIRTGHIQNDIEAVFHLGACSSTTEKNADFLMENNVRYAKEVCTFALEKGARFIQASSAATYGDGSLGFSDDLKTAAALRPLNMYGYSKQLFDLWAMREGLLEDITCVKFFNVYGPNEYHKGDMKSVVCKAVPELLRTGVFRLFRSDRPEYADGGQMRDFVYVKDCVNVLFWLMQHPRATGICNIGSGKARTWNDLARAVFAALDMPANIEYIDMPETLKGKYQYFTEADMSRIRSLGCDIPFHSLEAGIEDYVRGYLRTDDPYM